MTTIRLGFLAAALPGALLLSACAGTPAVPKSQAPAAPAAAVNPLFTKSTLPYELPPFDQIKSGHFRLAFDKGMADHLTEIQAIAANPDRPTFGNTVVAMERSGVLLNRVQQIFGNLVGANTDDELKKIEIEYSPKLSAHSDEVYLNAALYARVKALYDTRAQLGLNPEDLRLLEKYHIDFVRAGARLNDAQKTQMRAMNEELATLTTKFTQNLLADTNASAVVVYSKEELDGMSDEEIAAAAQAAKARGLDGKYVIQLILPTGQPALASLKNRALRERIYRASIMRSNHDNEFDNKAVLSRIVKLRADRAALLGYPNHAANVLEVETARTPEAVNKMLAQLAPAAVANAKKEAADMQKVIDAQKGAPQNKFKLEPWDWAFYAEQVRKARYDFDESQMKPYLEINHVLKDGVFYAAGRLYGLSFKERKDLPVYQEDVRTFEVFEESGKSLGLFLFDPYARESKRGGAWMSSYVSQNTLLGEPPVVAIHLNIPQPPKGQPALLTFDEVNTMFHEFGHALHGLFSSVTYPYFSGTNVPRDFVEYPSQVNEMWATWPEVLQHYAKHYQTGEPMPQAMVDKVKASEKFNQGYATTEYLAASLLDQAWHQLPPGKADVKDVLKFEDAALKKAGVKVKEVPPRYRSTYFNHVFAGGYSAGYYAYIWSEVLDADTVEWFKENGGLKRENGDTFRAKLLSKGGSVDAIALFKGFRGREPDINPLLERRGLTVSATK